MPPTRQRKVERFEPVTLGHIRGSATMNADWLPDETPVRSLCLRMVCTRCGLIGADVRPDWSPHVNKPRI
jgi:hypothetical protein